MRGTHFVARSPRGWQPGRLALGEPAGTFTMGTDGTAGNGAGLAEALEGMLGGYGEPAPGAAPAFPIVVLVIKYEFGRNLGFGPAAFHAPTGWQLHAALHHSPLGTPDAIGAEGGRAAELEAGMAYDDYAARVESIREGIRAGALYQANLAVPFAWRGELEAGELFARGCALGGADFAALVPVPDGHVVCFSPELFLRVRGRRIETRPIKGTRALPPGADPAAAIGELLSSEKDRAEHTMIVDLERNDLGRICEPGSIRVEPRMEAVVHPTVVHLESTVSGTLREGVGPMEVLRATFPGGSISGAPKRAALEWIQRHEEGPRGVFCGAIGWVDSAGSMDLALPIRTAEVRTGGGVFLAGGGITIDSDPASEWAEAHAKAAFFRRVLKGPGAA